MFSFREAPLPFHSHYPRAPCLRKAPLQQHASAPGQRSGIIEVVFIYLSVLNTRRLCDREKCSLEGRVEMGFSWGVQWGDAPGKTFTRSCILDLMEHLV